MKDYQSVVHSLPKRGTLATKAWYTYYQSVVHLRLATLLGVVLLLMGSCNEPKRLLPPSGGRLYEVLLVGDTDNIVRNVLQEDVEGLPQSEPQFDVSSINKSRFNQSVSAARNIVIVDIDPQKHVELELKYEKDVWAQPQIVAYINAPSERALKVDLWRIAPTLLELLNRAELNKSIATLKTSQNIKAEKLIKKMFGIDMLVPVDMTASHRGKDFLWLSNNSPTTMTNIVVYKDWVQFKTSDGRLYKYSNEPIRFVNARNYMLGKNIKGEVDSMHMQTVDGTVRVTYDTEKNSGKRSLFADQSVCTLYFYNGLWEMTGDDMGGPFVSRRLPMKKTETKGLYNCHNIVVEGFVFAPGKNKRNAIKQLEAALYTIKH